MDVRDAVDTDIDGIRAVARASLAASYDALDEELREQAVEAWYGDEGLAEDLLSEDAVVVVAVDDGEVVGFAQAYLVDRREDVGRIDWIHVHPDYRGQGLGEQLLGRAETELVDRGATRLEGRVLEANQAGLSFYEAHGYEAGGERTLDLEGEVFVEWSFTRAPDGEAGTPELVEYREGPEGQPLYVAYDESDRGSEAPFYVAYFDDARGQRYGWFCGNCEGFDINMDTMGRIECDGCGNRRKPTRWDATYGG